MRKVKCDISIIAPSEGGRGVEKKIGTVSHDCVNWYRCQKLLVICIFVILTFLLNIKIESKNFPTFYINLSSFTPLAFKKAKLKRHFYCILYTHVNCSLIDLEELP
jgi:hypothetical protein